MVAFLLGGRFFFLVRGRGILRGDLFFFSFSFFTWWGGSPLIGENKAFMAEPSLEKKGGCEYEKKKKKQQKKNGNKKT